MDNFNLKKFLKEGKLIKEEISKDINEVSFEKEIINITNQKNLQKGDKIKYSFSFSGWRDKTPVEHTGTFIRYRLILKDGMVKPFIPKYLKLAIGIMALIKDDKYNSNQLSHLDYIFDDNEKLFNIDDQKAFETLEKI